MIYKPTNGYSFIANSSAFVNAEDGINEKGLAVGMTYVWGKELKPGFSSMFFVRYILEKCASEATEAVKKIPIGGAYHLMIADERDIVHLECSPQKLIIKEGSSFAATNHFVSEEMKEFEEEKNLYFSHERFITAKNALNHESRINLLYHVDNILSGKHGFMCQYSKALKFDTVWSSLYDITGKKIYRAEGNPQKAKYKEDTRLKGMEP